MSEEDALYAVVRTNDDAKTPVGVVHYRYTWEESKKDSVLYLYEIQIAKEYRRKGLGKFLMQVRTMQAPH